MKLKESITINGLELKNRLVMPPMATQKAVDGKVTDELVAYYNEKSKGGHIGLIITEHAYVNKTGKASEGQVSIAKYESIEGYKKIANVVHANGSKIMAQISHAGSYTKPEITGSELMGPSAVVGPEIGNGWKAVKPREMTLKDIEQLKKDFANAAVRVRMTGFDGVEIHAAHVYLLSQFYSPITNKRCDAYGGDSLDGRTRLHREVIRAVRMAVGPDFPVSVRFGACDYMEGGSSIYEAAIAARIFEIAGCDMISISGGLCGYVNPQRKGEPGYFSELADVVKKSVSVPVLLTGGIKSADEAEILLDSGVCDMIGVGRSILKDSAWAEKNMK